MAAGLWQMIHNYLSDSPSNVRLAGSVASPFQDEEIEVHRIWGADGGDGRPCAFGPGWTSAHLWASASPGKQSKPGMGYVGIG